MGNLLVDQRDQKFVLHEMLNIGQLGETSLYGHLSKDVIDASLDAALKLAEKEFLPIIGEAEREGCRLENGQVYVPRCYHRLKEHFDQGQWSSVHLRREYGGQGFPLALWAALYEGFVHNAPFFWIWSTPFSGAFLLEQFGSQKQKERYLKQLVSGKWGSALAAHEDTAGSDLGMQKTVAIRQPDGSFRLKGTKDPVTMGDSDLFENLVHLVCARIAGDPAGEGGLSLFLVPKYLVNGNGSLGPRNDYTVVGLERKLGFNGNPTCAINYGENGHCYAELVGAERQAMPMLLQVMKIAEAVEGTMAAGIASTAYLHALDHAKKRLQGVNLAEAQNPEAPRVPIIVHPDVRRMLLWMKSQVEGMRALLYYSCLCLDKGKTLADPAEREKWAGLENLLLPVFRIYAAENGFKVADTAIQVHGRYGFFSDYPLQQFLRDVKQTAIGGITSGISALLLVAQTLGQREGQDFANLLTEMNRTIAKHAKMDGLQDLTPDLQKRVNLLGELGTLFFDCFKTGKVLVPIANATPFAHCMGTVCVGWLLFWQACLAVKRLDQIFKEHGVDPQNAAARGEFLSQNREAAFYDGKLLSARYFIKNVLPQVDSLAAAIKNEDLSLMTIHEESF